MTHVILTYVGCAVGFTAILIAGFWIVELLFGHRVGFYLSGAVTVFLIAVCLWLSYVELTDCTFSKAPAFPRCEWSPAFLLVVWSTTVVVLPLLTIATVFLRRLSDNRTQRLARG